MSLKRRISGHFLDHLICPGWFSLESIVSYPMKWEGGTPYPALVSTTRLSLFARLPT